MGWYGYGNGPGWVGFLAMVVAMVLFWVGLAALVVLVVRRIPVLRAHHRDSAEEVLAQRLARGEIDVDEYTRLLAVLRQR
jgi:putative membrane protein